MKTPTRRLLVGLFSALALGGAFGVATTALVIPSAPAAAATLPELPALDRMVTRLATDARTSQLAELR